jgi:MFS family permease
MSPAYNSLTSKAIPERYRGTAFGLIGTSLGLFSLPAPAIGAQLWERVSPRFPFQLMAGVAAFIVVPVWLKFKLPDKKEER